MTTPSHAHNPQRKARLVGGEDTPLEQADMLTEPVDRFTARLARQYADWPAFAEWMNERRHAAFAVVASVAIIAVLMTLPAQGATLDPCEQCQAEHGSACPCLPTVAEPPTTSLACIPATNDVSGCTDKVYLPMVSAVTDVTGEGGSGILPVRGAQ